MASILHYYAFHISQLSPMGMVRIHHFEFVCRSQGLEPTVDKFRTAWYEKFLALPNRVFGEQVLVTAGVSDKWPEQSREVPVLLFNGEEVALYQAAFQTVVGTMGVRPLHDDEELWYEQIKPDFLFATLEMFSNPPMGIEGVLHDLGIDSEQKIPKKYAVKKKKITVAGGVTIARSSGSTGSRGPDSGATPSSAHEEEETEAEVKAEKLIRKRPRVETTATTPPIEKVATSKPIGKKGSLRSLYRFSPEAAVKKPKIEAKKPEAKKPRFTIIPPKTSTVEGETVEVERPIDVTPDVAQGPELTLKDAGATGGCAGGSGAAAKKGDTGKMPRQSSPIRAESTLGDIYYKTYTEDRANEAHVPVWMLKQKDTFDDFGACRDWLLGTFPPGEVNRQTARSHENLYHSYVMGQANSSAAGHQILREWWTMCQERASWEKYHERLSVEAKVFEQAQIKLEEEKAAFEKENKSEEWGLKGLRNKLQASEDLLTKEQKEWRVACDNENKKIYADRVKITSLEADVANLKNSEAAFKEKYEEAKSHRERVEVALNAKILSKDRDLAGKDAEIAELKRRLFEAE
ncbi:hypothetical protein Hanom_Chr14g01247551 [Helianthus anomalus]